MHNDLNLMIKNSLNPNNNISKMSSEDSLKILYIIINIHSAQVIIIVSNTKLIPYSQTPSIFLLYYCNIP